MFLILETSIEAREAGEFEYWIVMFLVQFVAPIPCARKKNTLRGIYVYRSRSPRQSAVNTRSGVVEIVGSAAVECVFEEVLEDVQLTILNTSVGSLHHVLDVCHLGTAGNGLYDLHYGIEDPGNLTPIMCCDWM